MFRILVAALLIASSLLVHAQTPQESLSRCLADNTTGKDRKDLARWVFLAMAAHPEIKQYTSANAGKAAEETHKVMAGTFTRLLTDSCVQQTREAMKLGGGTAIRLAFRALGELAMQELMSDRDVNATMGAFEKHLDKDKFKVLGP